MVCGGPTNRLLSTVQMPSTPSSVCTRIRISCAGRSVRVAWWVYWMRRTVGTWTNS